MAGLAEYFNSRFQFYGRKLKLVFYNGGGDIVTEFQGGGQEEAEADAVKVAEEIKAFADTSAITTPFADALARRQVLNFGAPYMSRSGWPPAGPTRGARSPTARSLQGVGLPVKRVRTSPPPTPAAPEGQAPQLRRHRPREPLLPAVRRRRREGGQGGGPRSRPHRLQDRHQHPVQPGGQHDGQAPERGDHHGPLRLRPGFPVFLTTKAQEQGYEPEWIVTGVPSDSDLIGQLYQQDQWTGRARAQLPGTPGRCGPHGYPPSRRSGPTRSRRARRRSTTTSTSWPSACRWPARPDPETFERACAPTRAGPARRAPGSSARPLHADAGRPGDLWDPDAVSASQQPEGRPTSSPSRASGSGRHLPRPGSPSGEGPPRSRSSGARRSSRCRPVGRRGRLAPRRCATPRRAPRRRAQGFVLGTRHRPARRRPHPHLPDQPDRQLRLRGDGRRGRAPGRPLFVASGWNYWVAMGVGVAAGVAIGGIIELLVIRRFSNASRLVLTVATIGLAQVLGGLQLLIPSGSASPSRPAVRVAVHGRRHVDPVILTGHTS